MATPEISIDDKHSPTCVYKRHYVGLVNRRVCVSNRRLTHYAYHLPCDVTKGVPQLFTYTIATDNSYTNAHRAYYMSPA